MCGAGSLRSIRALGAAAEAGFPHAVVGAAVVDRGLDAVLVSRLWLVHLAEAGMEVMRSHNPPFQDEEADYAALIRLRAHSIPAGLAIPCLSAQLDR